ncbi:sulfurtransferase [Sphingomonas sp.]|uniref:sulfurtransferase n=1 Tax=Sphingomonas sp. TaxID=28214 RepID=UPI001EB1BA17|nr:sulfurtransferase [Sphingomonas sp.]MBX3595589.1 sulfurtransferase [Sphingomonas sp.]
MDPLVTPAWLANEIGAPDLRVLDATWFLPDAGRDPRAEFEGAHLPGAQFFDIAALSDPDSPFPTMLPDPARFAAAMSALGIDGSTRVILYDRAPHHTSTRAWWMFRAFGFDRVAILDGTVEAVASLGHPLTTAAAAFPPTRFAAQPDPTRVRSIDQMKANLTSNAEQVTDARSRARFTGQEAETRPGLAGGHIPNSFNTPYSAFFGADGRWKDAAQIRSLLEAEGIDTDRPIVATCGSGISAAVIVFALHLLGRDAALYDGSWTEWGSDPSTPKACGA